MRPGTGASNAIVTHYDSRPMPKRQFEESLRPPAANMAFPISILILCCLFWGFSFPGMQISAAIFENSLAASAVDIGSAAGQIGSRSIFNAWRFALASAAFYLLTFPRQRHFSRFEVLGGLAIGLTLVVIHLVGINITGTSVNPARSIGPALVGIARKPERFVQLWLFIVAPLIGAGAAGLLFKESALLDARRG